MDAVIPNNMLTCIIYVLGDAMKYKNAYVCNQTFDGSCMVSWAAKSQLIGRIITY